jgi:hypothetical protein
VRANAGLDQLQRDTDDSMMKLMSAMNVELFGEG